MGSLVSLVLVLPVGSLAKPPSDSVSQVKQRPCPSPHSVRMYAKKVFTRDSVSKRALARVRYLRGCQLDPKQRKMLRRYVRRVRRAYKERRRFVSSLLPFSCGAHGRFAVPCHIVQAESRFNCTAQNPSSTAYGYYQLLDTWWGHLGRKPTCEEQHRIAARLWDAGNGVSHWALTASG
jgi:hypothetical protein